MFRGWIDKTWQKQHEKHIQSTWPNDGKQRDIAKMWSVHLIDFMFTEGHKRWKERCDTVHKKIKRNETEQERLRVTSKVSAIYTLAMEVGYRDRHRIFSKTLEDKLKETVYQLD